MTDFWNTLDSAVAMLAAEDGGQMAAWTLARDFGSAEYRVVVKKGGKIVDFPPSEAHPVTRWLHSMGLPSSQLNLFATAAATEMVADARWTPVREAEHGWVRGAWRRPSVLAWQSDPSLSHLYWSATSQGRGLPDHAWVSTLRTDLGAPMEPAARRRVLGALGRMMSSYEDWEALSGLSLRAWAAENPAWQDVLDQAGLGYGAQHDGAPLIVAALANEATTPGWLRILPHVMDHRLDVNLPPEQVPLSWWDQARLGEAPSLRLWCWAARNASPRAWEVILKDRPHLLSDVDSSGCSALHWAALTGNEGVVTFLLDRGANPAVENREGLLPEEVVPSDKDTLYEQIASRRLSKRPSSA